MHYIYMCTTTSPFMFPFFREFRRRRKLPTRLQINLLHAAMHENSWVPQPVLQLVFHLSVFTCPLQQTIRWWSRWCILPWTIHQRLVNDQVKKRCKGIGLPSVTGIWSVILVCWVMTDLWMLSPTKVPPPATVVCVWDLLQHFTYYK